MYAIAEIITGLIGIDHPLSAALAWFSWALVLAAGVVVGFGKLSLSKTAILSLPFCAVWFALGLGMFAFGWGPASPAWSSEETGRMFLGFLVASAGFTVITVVVAIAGAMGARLLMRLTRSTNAA